MKKKITTKRLIELIEQDVFLLRYVKKNLAGSDPVRGIEIFLTSQFDGFLENHFSNVALNTISWNEVYVYFLNKEKEIK